MENGSPDGNLADILPVLESKTTGITERHETYQKFTSLFKENQISLFDMDVGKSIGRVLAVIKQDILLKSPEVSQCALQVLGVCLHDTDIVRCMSTKDCEDILDSLVECMYKTSEKGTCTRALWCIGKQNLEVEAVRKKTTAIVEAVEYSVEKFGNVSLTVEHECIHTVARLAEQCPREMEKESVVWSKLLLPLIVNSAIKVRERALNAVEGTLPLMKTHRKEIVAGVIPVLKTKVLPELQKLFCNKQELFVLKCWGVIVQLFGEELHSSTHINHLLTIVEMGFRCQTAEVKIAAYSAWQILIDNFSTNPTFLSDPKRIKLIMQVFKINNAKLENIAQVKLRVWWHFIWMLGSKITANFEQVAVPLLRFCLGGTSWNELGGSSTPRLLPNGTSPKTPRMNLTNNSSQFPVFSSLQLYGCEILAYFLGLTQAEIGLIEHEFKLDQLCHDVITGPTFFIKQSNLLITVATELFISLGKDVPESLLFHIWDALISHLKNAIDGPIKLDIRDTLNTLFTRFQVVVVSRVLSSQILLKMFESICKLPGKILGSSAYSIGGNEMISGTPALFLAGLLLTPNLLQACAGQEIYHTLFKTIIGCGVGNPSGALGFLQSVLELVKSNGKCVNNKEMIWRLWSAVVNPLLEHISKTSEVNQGDSLEPNFDCCVQALVLPTELSLASLPQPTVKTLAKTWTELYKTVDRLAALVTNANANVICENVCQKMVQCNTEDNMEAECVDLQMWSCKGVVTCGCLDFYSEAEDVDLQIQFCHVVVTCLDFSSIGTQTSFNIANAYSPKKPTQKSLKPLGNIHSLVTLLCHLQKSALDFVGENDQKKPSVSSQTMLNTLVDIYSSIFTHVSSSGAIGQLIGQLAEPIGRLFTEASKKLCVKVYNNAFQQKLEKLWMEMTTCVQGRYQGMFDSDFLSKLSPLLEATFLHSRRQIKNQTIAFWTSTFGSASNLSYPETLKPVLTKVKEKSTIHLPGWVNTNTAVIEETPVSQMSQSQFPEPRIPGMPSPHKIHGSFLNKGLSPRAKKSPMKSPTATTTVTRSANSAKKKMFKGLDNSNDDDLVVIKASPKKKMVLTEHQKEMMKERRVLPAMYNNLELSMDASLMSSHFTTDTQMESSSSTPTPNVDKEMPFSFFGSTLKSVSDQSQKIEDQKVSTQSSKEDTPAKEAEKKSSSETPTSKTTRNKKNATTVKSPESVNETNKRTRRASVLKKLEEKANDNKASTNVTTENKEAVSDVKQAESDKVDCNNKEHSVIVIEGSEPMDVEQSESILLEEKSKTLEIDLTVTKDSQGTSLSQGNGSSSFSSVPQNVLGAIGTTPPSSTSTSESDKSVNVNKEGDKLSDDGQMTFSASQKGAKMDDIPTKSSQKDKFSSDRELPSSAPLLSWEQKLEELSQSPGLKKSPFKSLSQDSKSPRKRGGSPHKSPRRKAKENLNMKGALDKWIIRSPTKTVGLSVDQNIESEIIVQSALSCTLVEETQSPSKFKKTDEPYDKTNSPSVMETPTKTILEELNVNHSHSNRKLFDSQGSNHDNDVEDSNLVPGSPNSSSTSFRMKDGTPIVYMKKLSNSDIKRLSPSTKVPKDVMNLTPTKTNESHSKPSRVKINADFSKTAAQDESSHEHDDFSDLKPLENDTDCTDVFSKSLTNTDQALLMLDEEGKQTNEQRNGENEDEKSDRNKQDDQVEQMETTTPNKDVVQKEKETSPVKPSQAVSPILFSQFTEQIKDNEPTTNNAQQEKVSGENDEILSQGFSTGSQSTQENIADSQDNAVSVEKETPRRGRKRKQITPKKMTPDDMKQKRKKGKLESPKDDEIKKKGKQESPKNNETKKKGKQESQKDDEVRTDRKVSKRLKEKKEKESQQSSQESGTDSQEQSDGHDSELNVSMETAAADTEQHTDEKLDGSQVSDNESGVKTRGRRQTKTKDSKSNDAKETPNKAKNDKEPTSNTSDMTETEGQTTETAKEKTADKESELMKTGVIGETTPKCRSTPKQPERRSTTKHKKEVSQKMVLKCQSNRDELVVDNNSNLGIDDVVSNGADDGNSGDKGAECDGNGKDKNKSVTEFSLQDENVFTEKIMDLVEDEVIKAVTKKLVDDERITAEILPTSEQMDNVDDSKTNVSEDKRSRSDVSSVSSDDLPLSQLKSENYKKLRSKKKDKKTEPDEQKSPVSNNKLRSNKLIGTRLRSGQAKGKEKSSPTAKKSVSLAIKRTRMKNKRNIKEKMVEENSAKAVDESENPETDGDDLTEPLVSIENVEKEFEKEADKVTDLDDKTENVDNKNSETNVEPDSLQEIFTSEIANENEGVADEAMEKEGENTDDTPRKALDISKQAASMLMMNSDSKLVVGSRRFEKRKAVARRSILKCTSTGLSSQIESPKRTDFHPISISHIYSPTASPSASILKKRRLLETTDVETSSPPTKQRRVSFADPLQEGPTDCTLTPLIGENNEKIATQSTKTVESQSTLTSSVQSSEGSITQGTYQSTQESQLNSTEPVCPDLVDCDQAVEKVLPQLTSSIWSRGLGQLVRARNIKTIGDLSALSEVDIQSLPIRSPKVETVRKTLSKYRNLQTKALKIKEAPKMKLELKIQGDLENQLQDEDPIPKPAAESDKAVLYYAIDVDDNLRSLASEESTANEAQLKAGLQKALNDMELLQDKVKELQQKLQQKEEKEDEIQKQNDLMKAEIEKQTVQNKHLQELSSMLQESHKSLVSNNSHLLEKLEDERQKHKLEVEQLNKSYNQLKKTLENS